MALIPRGPHVGRVLVWDHRGGCTPAGGTWFQRWAILDCGGAYPVVIHNGEITHQSLLDGDLFCSGHAWTEDGRLFVAGGTTGYSSPQAGNKLAFLFDPALPLGSAWIRLPDMAKDRWYPSVTRSSENLMVVTGGSQTPPQGATGFTDENTTEHFDLAAGLWRQNPANSSTWFQGPSTTASHTLGHYPRFFQLANQKCYHAGPRPQTSLVDIIASPEIWAPGSNAGFVRPDGASLIYPDVYGALQRVMNLGGKGFLGAVHESVEICTPLGVTATWSIHSNMKKKRAHLNAVILPNAGVVVFGGNGEGIPIQDPNYYHYEPEYFPRGGSGWELLAPAASERDYHSTAVLLRDGRVLTGGGDNRTWDYQIFSPPYFDAGEQEEAGIEGIALSATAWGYRSLGAGPYAASFNGLHPGISVARVVLMAPGSTTHHSDFDQRYVELEIVAGSQNSTSVAFWPPGDWCTTPSASPTCAPRGYYMLFLISNLGIPYGAGFIQLQ